MFGAVGRDAFAASALANLEASGIDLSGVVARRRADRRRADPRRRAGRERDHRHRGRQRRRARRPGSRCRSGPGNDARAAAGGPAGRGRATRRDARRGAHVVLNAAPAAALPDGLLRHVGTLIVNESEAAAVGAALGLPAAPDAFAGSGIGALPVHGRRDTGRARRDRSPRRRRRSPSPRRASTSSTRPAPAMRWSAPTRRRSIAANLCGARWPKASLPGRSRAPVAARSARFRCEARSRRWPQHFDTNCNAAIAAKTRTTW